MTDHVYGPVNEAVQSARLLSGLDACSLWALIACVMLVREWWKNKKEFENQAAWRKIREDQIIAQIADTEATRAQTEKIATMNLLLTKYLIKE